METKDRKKYTIILIGVALVSFYVFIVYSHKYNFGYTILPIIFLFGAFIFLADIWSDHFKIDKLPRLVRRLIYFGVIGLVFSALYFCKEKYERHQLHKYGVFVKGRVVNAEGRNGRNGFYFYDEIEYYYKNKTYEQHLRDSIYRYRFHDELRILCSSEDPELFKIISSKPALDIKY